MGPYDFYKHIYMLGIKCSSMLRERLSNWIIQVLP